MRARHYLLAVLGLVLLFPVHGYDWVSFTPCGIKMEDEDVPAKQGHRFKPAPSFRVIWVRASRIVAIWGFRLERGDLACSYVEIANGHRVLVIGTEQQILDRLRELFYERAE